MAIFHNRQAAITEDCAGQVATYVILFVIYLRGVSYVTSFGAKR
jgi:hypothetical protein